MIEFITEVFPFDNNSKGFLRTRDAANKLSKEYQDERRFSSPTRLMFASTFDMSRDYNVSNLDRKIIMKTQRPLHKFWFSEPLWPQKKTLGGLGKNKSLMPDDFEDLCEIFSKELVNSGLQFLADDLNRLWNNETLGTHWENYLINHPDDIINNSSSLRKSILG